MDDIQYYDPLLSRINAMDLNYEISANRITDINEPTSNIIKQKYGVSAFLDDTELFAPSPTNLGLQLSVTISFYKFTNVKVNNDKAILITNDTTHIASEGFINMLIDGTMIKLQATPINKQIRFLGVFFNVNGNPSQLI